MFVPFFYMGVVIAMRHNPNPVIKTFYERLLERGKPKKLAYLLFINYTKNG